MIQVYLVKRYMRKRKRNGAKEYRWVLRWEESGEWQCESTGTADRTLAEGLQKHKWAELNIPECQPEPGPEPEPEPAKATWKECKDALKRAMEADNLRPSYIQEVLNVINTFHKMFPMAQTPADVTYMMAQEFKRQRSEKALSPWSVKSDLAKLKAIFGKWLGKELGMLTSNPFVNVKPPKCDDPEVRIVSHAESKALTEWLAIRWNNWQLPLIYLEVLAFTGWRATETASIREEDLLDGGHIRVIAENCKTRRHKYGWLPPDLYSDLQGCKSGGWAFGRFSDELRRLHIFWRKRPRDAELVMDYAPPRLVYWMQDEIVHYHKEKKLVDRFSLHDFRRTAITGLQSVGVSEKETSLMVGATPEIIRKHYEKLDAMAIAKRNVERRLSAASSDDGSNPAAQIFARRLRAPGKRPLDGQNKLAQTDIV